MDEHRGTQKQIAKRYEDRVASKYARTPWRRARFLLSLLAFAGGGAAIYFTQQESPREFFNTGPLSMHHSDLKDGCASCHQAEPLDDRSAGRPRFFHILNDRVQKGAPSFERIDAACATCHQQHAFHEPNVIANRSCSACHKEHQGHGPMQPALSRDCATCHDNASVMQASAEVGKGIPPARFHLNPKVANTTGAGSNILRLPRPAEGYTRVFASFSEGHPQFQLQRDNVRENDVLRFNHQRHLGGGDIPQTKGGAPLDCTYCHKPAPNGRYMERIRFEAHCQECHSLQFDVRNPDFQLPHGDAQLVRTFLRTLPAQYGELARKRGLTSESRINEFAAQQVRGLLMQFASAEELERAVFFTSDPYKASQRSDPTMRAQYTGCAFCHEVKPPAEVTKPVVVDRWMPHAHFNHAKHQAVAKCVACHAAAPSSRLTSDVLMPARENCITCHNPTGEARNASTCMTCHTYHAPEQSAAVAAASGSFKRMLLNP